MAEKTYQATIVRDPAIDLNVSTGTFALVTLLPSLPHEVRSDVSHRILRDADFAASFRDGTFKHLHDTHARDYTETLASQGDGIREWFRGIADQRKIRGVVNTALKEANVGYKELLENVTLSDKISKGVYLGLGAAAVGLSYWLQHGWLERHRKQSPSATVPLGEPPRSAVPSMPDTTIAYKTNHAQSVLERSGANASMDAPGRA